MVHVVIVLFMAVVDDGRFIFHGKFVFLVWSLFLNQVVFVGVPLVLSSKKSLFYNMVYTMFCAYERLLMFEGFCLFPAGNPDFNQFVLFNWRSTLIQVAFSRSLT